MTFLLFIHRPHRYHHSRLHVFALPTFFVSIRLFPLHRAGSRLHPVSPEGSTLLFSCHLLASPLRLLRFVSRSSSFTALSGSVLSFGLHHYPQRFNARVAALQFRSLRHRHRLRPLPFISSTPTPHHTLTLCDCHLLASSRLSASWHHLRVLIISYDSPCSKRHLSPSALRSPSSSSASILSAVHAILSTRTFHHQAVLALRALPSSIFALRLIMLRLRRLFDGHLTHRTSAYLFQETHLFVVSRLSVDLPVTHFDLPSLSSYHIFVVIRSSLLVRPISHVGLLPRYISTSAHLHHLWTPAFYFMPCVSSRSYSHHLLCGHPHFKCDLSAHLRL